MDKPSSYSVAPGHSSRLSILSRGALLGVVGMALIGLVLVFPKDDLLSRLRRNTVGADRELTIAYLRNLIRTEQNDVGLRILLVEKLIVAREFDEAQTVVTQTGQLSIDAGQRVRLGELDSQLAWARFRAVRERLKVLQDEMQWDQLDGRYRSARADASKRAASLKQLRQELEGARKQLEVKLRAAIPKLRSSKAAFDLMEQASDVGQVSMHQEILRRLLAVNLSADDAVLAARRALAMGLFKQSSDFYLVAKNKTTDLKKRQELALLSANVLLASGQPKQAYETILAQLQGQDALPAGSPLWWQLIDWALAAGVPKDAAKHLMQVIPTDWDSKQIAQNLKPEQLAKALDVALAGADLPEAIRLAQAGLIQKPQDSKLRERFAQVLEWGGKPQEAMAQWLLLMQQGVNQRAQVYVFRLAPMLFDDDALLAAWVATSTQRQLSIEEIKRVVEVYEKLGQPEKALTFLDRMQANSGTRNGQTQLLQALILERMGKPAQALAILEDVRQRTGQLDRIHAMRLAALHMQRADYSSALKALMSYSPPTNAEFDVQLWDMRADLAYEANQVEIARQAWDKLLAFGVETRKLQLRDYQAERMVRDAMDRECYAQAVSLAKQMRQLMDTTTKVSAADTLMTLWLDALAAQSAKNISHKDLEQWMTALLPVQRQRLGQNPEWLNRRALVYMALGEKKLAAQDYRASLAFDNDASVRAAYLWLLIDMADSSALRTELAKLVQEREQSPVLLEVQGAGWQLLGEWRQALGFYRLQTKDPSKAQDAMWLANYSDVLEQAGDTAIALRIRKQSFILLNQAMAKINQLTQREAAQALILRVRLSESFASGSEKERLQKLLWRTLHDDSMDTELRKQAQGLIVSWALGSEHGSGPSGARTELARRWLWMQQARKLTAEDAQARVYAQTALALAEGDVQTLDHIMEHSASQLQTIDRLNALRQLSRNNPQRLAQAATYGVELAQKEAEAPRNEQLQEALEQDLLKLASKVRITPVSKRSEVLSSRGVQINADIALSPRLRLTMDLDRISHHSTNPAALVLPALQDLNFRVGARLAVDGGEFSGQFTLRNAWQQVSGLALQLTRQLDPRTSLQARMELRQPSSETAALSVAGMQDRVALNLTHQVARDAVVGIDTSLTRYRTQDGSSVGQGKRVALNGTYFLRREYPDMGIRANIGKQSMRASGTPDPSTAALNPTGTVPTADFYLPQSATTLNLSLGYGLTQSLDNREAYSRAWRPYAEIGAERRLGASSKTSPWMRMGVRGSAIGRDQLIVEMEVKPAPDGASAAKMNRQLRIQYEWIGDR